MTLSLAARHGLKIAGIVLVAVIFGVALYVLQEELRHVHWADIRRELADFPLGVLVSAGALTLTSYLILTSYDYLGTRYAARPLSYGQVAPASLVTYIFSNNLGFFGGAALRFRFYSAHRLSTEEVTKVVFFCGLTFWLGMLAVGGTLFLVNPPVSEMALPLPAAGLRALGAVFVLAVVAYVAACLLWKKPVRVMRWDLRLPSFRLALGQILFSTLDWLVASSVLFVLLSHVVPLAYADFLPVYMLAIMVALVSHVPAGIGVFETVFLLHFGGGNASSMVAGVLILYRVIYYIMPLGVGAVLFGVLEAMLARERVRKVSRALATWFPLVAPRLLTYLTFGMGVVLLVSGALPAVAPRRAFLEEYLPLPIVETSHLLGSVVGVMLVVVARGLQRRLDGAYVMAIVLLASGSVLSLLKGLDYEEALVLAFAALLLYPCRDFFYRHASLLHQRFTPSWGLALGLTVMGLIWLVLFAYKHVEYSHDLWWTFSFKGDAPRSMRATVAAVVAGIALGLVGLLKPSRHMSLVPAAADLQDARRIVDAQDKTAGYLSLLADKALLFNAARTSFVMYGVAWRSWVALGDPVGPLQERSEMIWLFREMVDRVDGWTVFYQIDTKSLNLYLDAGLTLLKLGEEAIVDLQRFTLEGRQHKAMRNVYNRFEKEGWEFTVVPEAATPALLAELKSVSDDWLTHKNVREKTFSLGSFSPRYLANFPMAIVRREGRVVAFANIWATALKQELSVDLMRYASDAPRGIMDFLFVHLMLWGKANGYQTFNLGMAPFSGIEVRNLAPMWSRMGSMLYRYGEHFYNFKGIREYKEKFEPTWQPKYMACTSGMALPLILANVSALISGGVTGVIRK